MAKLNEEKVLEQVSELPIDDQVTFYFKMKELVLANLSSHQQDLAAQSTTYQNIKDRINCN